MGKDDTVDIQNKKSNMSLYRGKPKLSYFPDFQNDILEAEEVNNKDTKEEGDWGWAYLAERLQGNNMADDELIIVGACTSSFYFETKLLLYFLVD